MTTRSKVLLGILGAAAAGVAIGMLVYPEKSKEIGHKIKRTAGDWADNLGHLWTKGKKAAEDLANEADGKINKMKESYS